jgi:murein DD-endopeptidase MepM/ murein hydrolase activator NlpD
MKLTIRKCAEQQAQLTFCGKVFGISELRTFTSVLLLVLLTLLSYPSAHADIYRFVTIDGVETFTDAPSDKSAVLIIKDRRAPAEKQKKKATKQKTHDISLNEIVEKAVTASHHQNEPEQSRFELTLPAVGGTITSQVGMRIDPVDGVWRQHNGIDIAIPTGTPVKPVSSGVVVYCGNRSGYGNTIVVEHDNGVITLYAHNSRNLVAEGQPVSADTIIALSGSTGRSTGPHLHFEAWQAGTNVTSAFLPDSGVTLAKTVLATTVQRARFRNEVLSDGSILFTNIPASTP